MGSAPIPKSVEILEDEEDKNKERDEAKAKAFSVCPSPLCWMYYFFYNEKDCCVILDLLSTLSFDST